MKSNPPQAFTQIAQNTSRTSTILLEVIMMGVVETEAILKTVPSLVQGGVKLFEFGKTRKELAAARGEIAL